VKLLPVDDARALMLARVRVAEGEAVPIGEVAGRVLAQAIAAVRDQPPFDASAMDGWAVRRADAASAAASLHIAGESAAGHAYAGELRAGEAVRIFTGAPVPAGADMVVIQENAEREGDGVRVGPLAEVRDHIRRRGGDFRQGAVLLEPGRILDPWALSLAAAAGIGAPVVARRPRVAILATGEELVAPGEAAGPHQIHESGSFAVAAQAAQAGAVAWRLRATGDSEADIEAAVSGADCDLVVTIGGASVGDYDLVKPALARLGLTIDVESVNLRPGKPTWFGVLGDGRLVLGLPGNPASAMVCAELFLKPIVLAMQGADPAPRHAFARLAGPLRAEGPREHYQRARSRQTPQGLVVEPLADQDSALVTVFAQADCLVRRPANAPAAAAGDFVELLPLARG
jgi:molybdopterin molybdotransferase